MEIIEIRTLIDITNTRVTRPNQGNQSQLDQQRNFITLLQCIGLKSIISYDEPPKHNIIDLKLLSFGSKYKGKQNVWEFRFTTDRDKVYEDNDANPLGLLIEDIHEVPVIKNLTETVNIEKPIFDCKDPVTKNVIINFIKN